MTNFFQVVGFDPLTVQAPQGPAGPQGPQGSTGSTGAQGATGATGPQGPAVTDASSITGGTLAAARLPDLSNTYLKIAPAPSGDTSGVTDTAALSALIVSGTGVIQLQKGTYWVTGLTLQTGVVLQGAGRSATVVKLANGSNVDLVTTLNFGTLTGGGTQAGPSQFGIRSLTLDGNGANQTSSWVLRIYGSDYIVDNAVIQYGKTGGVWSEWGNGGTNMEARWSNFRVSNNGGVSVDWNGPHDSQFTNGVINLDGSGPSGSTYGIRNRGHSTGEMFTNVHVWGGYSQVAFYLENLTYCVNCYAEGAQVGQVMLGTSGSKYIGGTIYGTNGAASLTEKGLLVGDGTHTGISGCIIDTDIHNISGSGYLIDLTNSIGGNQIKAAVQTGTHTDTDGVGGVTIAFTTGSTTISNSVIKVGDTGKAVTGAGVPANATVGNVSAGTFNFMVSGTPTLPTANFIGGGSLAFTQNTIFNVTPRGDEHLWITCKDNPNQNWISFSNASGLGFNYNTGTGGVRFYSGTQVSTGLTAAFRVTNANGTVTPFQVDTTSSTVDGRKDATNKTWSLASLTGGVQPGTASGVGSTLFSGTGAPTIAGALNDLYVRTDGAVGTWLYRCSTAGGAGVAVWTAFVGGGSGGVTRSVSSVSSPTTGGATALTDYVYLVSGTTTLTLPTAVGNSNLYTVKNSGSNTVTIATTSSQTIDGSSTASLPVANSSLDLISDGANWRVI